MGSAGIKAITLRARTIHTLVSEDDPRTPCSIILSCCTIIGYSHAATQDAATKYE